MSRATCNAIDTLNKHNPTDMAQTEKTVLDPETLRWWTTPKRGPLGWGFSPKDEWLAAKAMREASEFMRGYGKGQKPRMVDKSRYEQGIQPIDTLKDD